LRASNNGCAAIVTSIDLKRKRLGVGLSVLELSRRARVSRWRLTLAECGEIKLRKDELARIDRVLKRKARLAAYAALGRAALREG
jgi:predicted transcriptional regulator